MLIQMMAISDLWETLIILGFDARMMLLKMCKFLRVHLMSSDEMRVFDLLI